MSDQMKPVAKGRSMKPANAQFDVQSKSCHRSKPLEFKLWRAVAAVAAMSWSLPTWALDVPTLQDTFVSSVNPGTNYGGWGTVKVGEAGALGLVSFDLAAALPTGLKADMVTKATLIVYQEWVLGVGAIEVIRLVGSFNEATTTFLTRPVNAGPGTGRTAALTGSQRFLLIDVTDMVKATIVAQSPTLGFALAPALTTPGASVQLGSKEGRYPAKLDITVSASTAAPAPSYAWFSSTGSLSCLSVCSAGGAIAAANPSGQVCLSQDGARYSYETYVSTAPYPGPPPGYWCGPRATTAQCSCLRK